MRIRTRGFLGILLILSFALAAGASPLVFSLDRYSQSQAPSPRLVTSPVAAPGEAYTTGAEAKKRPWIAALETFSINIGVWVIDRYIRNVDFSHISWDTIKFNFKHGFIWDNDVYGTGFMGHPYHGSQYYNTARSLGLNVWESIPYATVGYWMWGFFLENDQPSYNDTITTTLGGVSLGELEYRLSSDILDDSATGGDRVWREIVGMLIDPIRGLNRLIYGDMFATSSINRQLREPLHGNITLGGMLVSDASNLTTLHFSPGLMFDMIYGLDSSDIVTDHPFDLIFLNGEIRYSNTQSRAYLSLGTYGPWYAKEWDGKSGQKYAVGLFQHYDYLNNEALQMGGTSTTLGFVTVQPLGHGLELKASVQAGGLLLSGVKNDIFKIEDRDYNYGLGFTGKVEAWLSHPTYGTLSLHFSHFRSSTIGASAPTEADESHDFLTLFSAQYSVPISAAWGVSVDYGRFALRQHFEGHPNEARDSSRIGAALVWHF